MAGKKRAAPKSSGGKPAKRLKAVVTDPVDEYNEEQASEEPDNSEEEPSEDEEEPVITPAKMKKVKAKKVAGKSPAKDGGPSRDSSGRLVSSSRMEVDPDIPQAISGEFRLMCVRCAKEVNTFPDLRCWHASGSKSSKCADCQAKGKACDPVSSPVSSWSFSDS